jgi:hypothetical protein
MRHAPCSEGHSSSAGRQKVGLGLCVGLRQRWRGPGTELELTWRGLPGGAAARAAYLRALDPAALPALLGAALTAPLLASLAGAALAALQAHPDAFDAAGDDADARGKDARAS